MRRIGIILVFCTLWVTDGFAASRISGASANVRSGAITQKVRTQTAQKTKTVRVATTPTKTISRSATPTKTVQRSVVKRSASTPATTTARTAVVDRIFSETRTGAEYEKCKSAYFACMDQFCQLKNDEYRRCSCNDRITSLQEARNKLQQAGEQLTVFNENLDIVGKTAAQATAMNTASDGELALTKDNSASKALLTAIMNSIRGTDSRVENNQLSDLNSIDLSFDATNSFGTTDVGQAIASYNGQALYSAVYPQCRNAVKSSCNDASLQRAVNAYLMAIEQDCNTVQTAISNKQKETHAAIRESSSMLDMARAENHKNHNSNDAATCLTNVENAVLSEEVCGANYHKCLDNGEYIDVSTGAPIAGVVDFYKLGTLLTFNSERGNNDQKLAQNLNNRTFVTNFEKRVKQFAEPALDKCADEADEVWQDYLNKAMLDIYYAQQSKVNEIKQGCFDFVSACYMNGSTSMTNAMQGLVAAQTTTLNPNVLNLNKSLCSDYIASCNNMFDGDIVNNYIKNRHDTDSLTACRAVVQQCFDNYGGQNYENFYYPSSGLFATGAAPDWFALYDCEDSNCTPPAGQTIPNYKSECAKQLAAIEACSEPEMVEAAFGGFNYYAGANVYNRYAYNNQKRVLRSSGVATEIYNQIIDILQTQCSNLDGKFMNVQSLALYEYNYSKDAFCEATFHTSNINDPTKTSRYINIYIPYSIGKKTSKFTLSYKQPITAVSLIEQIDPNLVSNEPATFDATLPLAENDFMVDIRDTTSVENENMCPRDYNSSVDVQSWGACLCWENGGRRSNNGTSTRCTPSFPVKPLVTYDVTPTSSTTYTAQQVTTYGLNNSCGNTYTTSVDTNNKPQRTSGFTKWPYTGDGTPSAQDWCTAEINNENQVCPFGVTLNNQKECNECRDNWSSRIYCPTNNLLKMVYICQQDGAITTVAPTSCSNTSATIMTMTANGDTYYFCSDNSTPECPAVMSVGTTQTTYNLISTGLCVPTGVSNTTGTLPMRCPSGYTESTQTNNECVGNYTQPVRCCPNGYYASSTLPDYCCPAGTVATISQLTQEMVCTSGGGDDRNNGSILDAEPVSSFIMNGNFPKGNK